MSTRKKENQAAERGIDGTTWGGGGGEAVWLCLRNAGLPKPLIPLMHTG